MSDVIRKPEEISSEIEILKGLRDRIRPYNLYGDNNQSAIDAQILTLEKKLRPWQLYAKWESDFYVLYAALDALDWLIDKTRRRPTEDWLHMIEKDARKIFKTDHPV